MERAWVFSATAVTVTLVDFADPALEGEPDVRERGVRLEIRPVRTSYDGSVYASDPITLGPARSRVDLLESRPHAADRMHWHPGMAGGEPGDRSFDVDMPADPVGWVRRFLDRYDDETTPADRDALARSSEEIATVVAGLLERAREPWPEVSHDARGMAPA